MALPGISNGNEFYSAHYLESVLSGDIKKVKLRWAEEAKAELEAVRARIDAGELGPAPSPGSAVSATAVSDMASGGVTVNTTHLGRGRGRRAGRDGVSAPPSG